MKLELSQHILEELSNVKVHKKTARWEQGCCADWWADRHDEGNSRFSQYCESA
jgi:hypothetical protein